MDKSSTNNINTTPKKPLKNVWELGPKHIFLVSLDKEIAQKLGINENDTFLEQELTEDNTILMRVKKPYSIYRGLESATPEIGKS